MPDNNPLVEAFKYLFTGSPQQGPGLFSPQNIGNAMRRTGQEIQTIMAPTPPSPSPIDLGTINVQRRQGLTQASVPQPPAGITTPSAQPQRQPINWQAIADIGIPALSALIGSVAPGTLPAAAGISTGYTGAREKQREKQREKEHELELKNIEKEETKRKEIRSRADKIAEIASTTYKDPDEVLREIEKLEEKLNIPKTKTGESLKTQTSPFKEYPEAFQEDGVWKVIKDGKKYRIEQ